MEYEEWWEKPMPNYSVWFRTDVISVSDNSVSHNEIVRMFDGTSEDYQSTSELPYFQNGNWVYGYPINLNNGDSFMRGEIEYVVLDEIQKTYAEHERIVLVIERPNEHLGNATYVRYYFDKETGILLEFEQEFEGYKDGYFLVKTNLWDDGSGLIPSYPLLPVLLGILIYYYIARVHN